MLTVSIPQLHMTICQLVGGYPIKKLSVQLLSAVSIVDIFLQGPPEELIIDQHLCRTVICGHL